MPSNPTVVPKCSRISETSSSMPTETKNRLAKTSRAGIRSVIT